MRKITILATSWLLTCLTLSASPLSPEQALQRLDKTISTRGADTSALRYAHTIKLSDGDPGLYIFENGSQSGYAILSADDAAAPLLGYSDKGKFDKDAMSPEMQWWLDEYARQIEYAKSTGAAPYQAMTTRAEREAIAPMIATRWNQSAPYNLQTPEVDGRNCVTGCVATAMAQVMKFWNYPETGQGVGECTVLGKDGKPHTERMLLNEQNFDWANMLDTYDDNATEEQKAAVAYLMKACGYSTQMGYSLSQSGTAVFYVASALIDNFSYNPNLQYCRRNYYTATEWNNLIYKELSNGRPVVYGGQSTQGGHCFVCDGYDANEYFHFNWGWGGMSDGYFLLDALNPGSLGIGANGGGYNFDQVVVTGVQPTVGETYTPDFEQQGNMAAIISGVTFTLQSWSGEQQGGWFNLGTKPITIDLGAKIEPLSPTTGETTYTEIETNHTFQAGYGYSQIKVSLPASIKDGSYRLTLCYRLTGTEEWTPVRCETEDYNYIEFTKERLKCTLIPLVPAVPKIEDAELLTPLYYGEAVKMSLTVSNPSGKELTSYFYPALYYNSMPYMKGDGVTLTLAPGEKVTKEFACVFDLMDGKNAPTEDTTYKLYFYDPSSMENTDASLATYEGFSKDVTMKIDAAEPDITINEFIIKGYETINDNGYNVYNVTDAASIPFTLSLTNNGAYFAKPVEVVIFPYVPNQQVYSVASESFTPVAMLTQGESATLTANVNLSTGEIGKLYTGVLYVDDKPIFNTQRLFKLAEPSGVESVGADTVTLSYDKGTSKLIVTGSVKGVVVASMDGTAYDKSGEAATGTVDLSALPSGIYVVKAIGADGTAKTLKIMIKD